MRRTRILTGIAFGATLVASLLTTASSALAVTALPAHVFSPYFETWTTDSVTTIAQQSA